MDDTSIDAAHEIVLQVRPLLFGQKPEVQAIVIADLAATWVAGHHGADPTETQKIRAFQFKWLTGLIKKLIRPNADMIAAAVTLAEMDESGHA